jgi:hypothetical protein
MKASLSFKNRLKLIFGFDEIVDTTELEDFCTNQYTLLKYNLAYKNKRKINGIAYSEYLNNYIMPGAFGVETYLVYTTLPTDLYQCTRSIGNKVAQDLTWTDDKNLDSSGDYYLTPSEVLATRKGDCEDHAYLMASLIPDLGVAYGFWNGGGHAFNVLLYDGELWVVDTVGDRVNMVRYQGQTEYKIHYIITQHKTFLVTGGVHFGQLAGWSD